MKKLVAVLLALCFLLSGCSKSKPMTVENAVDNSYNNYIAGGKLSCVDSKLYYFYDGDEINYGIYRISEKGGDSFAGFGSMLLTNKNPNFSMLENDNHIYCGSNELNLKNGKFSRHSQLPQDNEQYQIEGIYEEKPIYSMFRGQVTLNSENFDTYILNHNDTALIRGYTSLYIDKRKIYYAAVDQKGICSINSYDLTSKQDETLFSFDNLQDEIITEIIADGDKLFFMTSKHDKLLLCNLANLKISIVGKYKYISSFNYFDGTLYICSHDKGVESLKDGKKKALCSAPANECYIVDSDGIYFIDTDKNLKHINQNGNAEIVMSKK